MCMYVVVCLCTRKEGQPQACPRVTLSALSADFQQERWSAAQDDVRTGPARSLGAPVYSELGQFLQVEQFQVETA